MKDIFKGFEIKFSFSIKKKIMQGGVLSNFPLDIFGYASPDTSQSC